MLLVSLVVRFVLFIIFTVLSFQLSAQDGATAMSGDLFAQKNTTSNSLENSAVVGGDLFMQKKIVESSVGVGADKSENALSKAQSQPPVVVPQVKSQPAVSAVTPENKVKLVALDEALAKNTIQPVPVKPETLKMVELDPLAEVSMELDKIKTTTKDENDDSRDDSRDDSESSSDSEGDGESEPVVSVAAVDTPKLVASPAKMIDKSVEIDRAALAVATKNLESLQLIVDKLKSEISLLSVRVESLEKPNSKKEELASSLWGRFSFPLIHTMVQVKEVVKAWVWAPIQKMLVHSESVKNSK